MTKPTIVIAPLDGTKTFKQLRNKGAEAVLFVCDTVNDEGQVSKYAFLVNGGRMTFSEVEGLFENLHAQAGFEHHAYLNFMDVTHTLISGINSDDPVTTARVMVAFRQALELTGVLPKFQQMLFDSGIQEIDDWLRNNGLKA
jgi:hypothetical protein